MNKRKKRNEEIIPKLEQQPISRNNRIIIKEKVANTTIKYIYIYMCVFLQTGDGIQIKQFSFRCEEIWKMNSHSMYKFYTRNK